jgi:hypothetical protein
MTTIRDVENLDPSLAGLTLEGEVLPSLLYKNFDKKLAVE